MSKSSWDYTTYQLSTNLLKTIKGNKETRILYAFRLKPLNNPLALELSKNVSNL